jgi:hypothetical protein
MIQVAVQLPACGLPVVFFSAHGVILPFHKHVLTVFCLKMEVSLPENFSKSSMPFFSLFNTKFNK